MAGDFWKSSHFSQWIFNHQDLIRTRQTDLKILQEDEYFKVFFFLANVVQSLGEQMKVRQQVIATASVYLRRFYAKNPLKSVDPLLMIPACLHLASKVEEFTILSNTKLIPTFQNLLKCKFSYAFGEFNYTVKHISECEFVLLEVLDCSLIVYHPYRLLPQYVADMTDSPTERDKLTAAAWKAINDSLRSDIPLLFPPYLITLACLLLVCSSSAINRDYKQWFAELAVDMDKIIAVLRYLTSLYEISKKFDEKSEIPNILAKIPKPNRSSSTPLSHEHQSSLSIGSSSVGPGQSQSNIVN